MIDEEELMDIKALHKQGLTYAEIGRLIGRDWRTDKRYPLVGMRQKQSVETGQTQTPQCIPLRFSKKGR
jgi:hypothetical protein